jgi:DNA-binding GntR family transcriptional regulator
MGVSGATLGNRQPVPVPIPRSAREIADDLTRRIAAGEFRRGQRLPTYNQLAEEYGSARRTVARAVDILKASGVVVGVQGSGIYVAED